jgi:hypothetical protein
MDEIVRYFVRYPEETQQYDVGPGTPIPTLGSATTVCDLYRIVGIAHNNLPDIGVVFTDTSAAVALSKIAEGGLCDVAEIEAAETALQALLLHERVHVLVPGLKISLGSNQFYVRKDPIKRTQVAFDLLALAGSRDWLVASEFVRFEGGVARTSTLAKSPLLGKSIDQTHDAKAYWSNDVAESLILVPEELRVPAYLTDSELLHGCRGDGFHRRFYHGLNISWAKAVGGVPKVVTSIDLPPLLAIVLNRLTNRQDLVAIVRELREELSPCRAELVDLNRIVTHSTDQADIERRSGRIAESFAAIIPESRLSGAQRIQRRLFSFQRLVRPLISLIAGFWTKNDTSIDAIAGSVNQISQEVLESDKIIDRTVTANMFSELTNTESVQSLMKHHFTTAELASLERSDRRRKSPTVKN